MFWEIGKILKSLWATFLGFMVTLKYYFLPSHTYQYPKEKKPIAPRFRGLLAFHPEICISCEMCVRVCPSDVISMEWVRNEETKKKELKWYQIDFSKCNVCRLCEEVCPTKIKSIHHSNEFEVLFDNRSEVLVRWGPTSEDTVQGGAKVQQWYRYMPDGRKEKVTAVNPNPEAAQ
jgi:NADH-quinone oxidoreductase chain I